MPESLKKWNVVITSVGQEYESIEECYDYKTSTGTTYGGRGQPMDIGKSNEMGSLSTLTATSMDTWPRNAKQRKKNKRPEYVLNVTKKGISPEITKRSR